VLVIVSQPEEDIARRLVAPLSERVAGVFTDVRPHVPLEVAEAARGAAARCWADAVMSIGGGSTTGTAKAVALTTGLPVVAVPTTYAGSEVTPVWGITEDGRKATGTDLRVLPRVVLYDPALTVTLPPALSAVSGLNAVAHCVEAFRGPSLGMRLLRPSRGIRRTMGEITTLRDAVADLVRDGDLHRRRPRPGRHPRRLSQGCSTSLPTCSSAPPAGAI
jgi:maleylacetate reductase